MRKGFLKIIASFMSAALILPALTGCHGKKGSTEFTMPEGLDPNKTYEIVFWAKNDTNITQTKIYNQAIEDFEKLYPNIKVNLRLYTDYNKIYNDVITNIATGTTPNVCITYPDHIATYLTGDNCVVALDELFRDSDIISLHCPLTDETHHLINAESIAKMKPTVTIINTSRGGLINTYDLIQGLKEKRIGAACLDVYEEESDFFYEDFSGHIVRDDKLVRLIAMPNVLVTSHQAFLTEEALSNIAETTIDNLLRFFRGEPNPATEVRYEDVAHI